MSNLFEYIKQKYTIPKNMDALTGIVKTLQDDPKRHSDISDYVLKGGRDNYITERPSLDKKIKTLTFEKDDHDGIWLCSNDLDTIKRLAEFNSYNDMLEFIEIFNNSMMKSHAQGAMGI